MAETPVTEAPEPAESLWSLRPPFLPTSPTSQSDATALLHLRRDSLVPIHLKRSSPGTEESTGYAEGAVTNTRFGSFPHSTLLDVPWGSQVRASIVDTGSRGQKKRKKQKDVGKTEKGEEGPARSTTSPVKDQPAIEAHPTSPRKRNADTVAPLQPPKKKLQTQQEPPKQAATGFAHLLPLTPEAWTISLPHRTQVVYTPDYSYVIQRLRIRPGSRVIEAGAGSGSFTHAAARAVYNGREGEQAGRVFSYEYHKPRAEQLKQEVNEHGLGELVTVTHRDVYKGGFLVLPEEDSDEDVDHSGPKENIPDDQQSPNALQSTLQLETTSRNPRTSPMANAIFLDLPDPSRALPNLTHQPPHTTSTPPLSPLDPARPAHLCAFLPCIEQAQTFIAALRTHSFVEISMSELMHRRLEVRRERVGLDLEGLRGVNAMAASVKESVERLKEVQRRDREFREASALRPVGGAVAKEELSDEIKVEGEDGEIDDVKREDDEFKREEKEDDEPVREPAETRAARLERIKEQQKDRKPWKEGRLVCRTEPELKSHTSYLVFAVLPREWTEEDEKAARERWGSKESAGEAKKDEAKRMSKKERKEARKLEQVKKEDERPQVDGSNDVDMADA